MNVASSRASRSRSVLRHENQTRHLSQIPAPRSDGPLHRPDRFLIFLEQVSGDCVPVNRRQYEAQQVFGPRRRYSKRSTGSTPSCRCRPVAPNGTASSTTGWDAVPLCGANAMVAVNAGDAVAHCAPLHAGSAVTTADGLTVLNSWSSRESARQRAFDANGSGEAGSRSGCASGPPSPLGRRAGSLAPSIWRAPPRGGDPTAARRPTPDRRGRT